MSTPHFYIRTKGDERAVDYYWAGHGWWTRRKDQAKRFDTRESADAEMHTAVTIEQEPKPARELAAEPAQA